MPPTTPTPGSARRHFVADNLRFARLLSVLMLVLGLLSLLPLWLGMKQTGLWLSLAAAFLLPLPWVARLAWGRQRATLTLVPGKGLKGRNWVAGMGWRLVQDMDVQLRPNGWGSFLSLHLVPGAPWPVKPGLLRRKPRCKPGQGRELAINLSSFKPETQRAMLALIVQDYMRWRVRQGLPAETPRMRQERSGNALVQALQREMPQPWSLYLAVALNLGMWLLTVAQGLDPFSPNALALYAWGANSTYAVVSLQEYWRLLVATVLHGGLLHLLLNMLGLWGAGIMLNRLYGHARFWLIYLGSALAGSALSLHFAAQQSVAVGASGAVFGVLGAWLLCLWRHRQRLPSAVGQQQVSAMAVYVLCALSQGFLHDGIDNAAHIGGLLMGCALAALLPDRASTPPGPLRSPGWRDATALALVATAVGTLVLLANPAQSTRFIVIQQSADRLDALIERRDAMQQGLLRQVESLRQDDSPFNPTASAIRQDLNRLQIIRREMLGMANTHSPSWDELLTDLLQLTQLDMDTRQTILDALSTPDGPAQTALIERLKQQLARQNQVAERLRARQSKQP